MTTLISQMLGCLIVAAGIGGIVGWLVRNLSTRSLEREFVELSTVLRKKEQALGVTQYELKVKTSAVQTLENKVVVAEALAQSAQKDLSVRNERLSALQEELATKTQRLSVVETELAAWHQQATHSEVAAAEQSEHIAHLTRSHYQAQQEEARLEQELVQQQQRIAELEAALTASDHLRTRVQELEPAQGRVHWLEVQLSEREAHHRTALQDLEQELARRDQTIREIEPLREQLQAQADEVHVWEERYAASAERHAKECAGYEEQLTRFQNLEALLTQQQQASREKDSQIRALKQQIREVDAVRAEMAGRTKLVEEQEEEISRLRKRLVEVRAALRIRTDGAVAPRFVPQGADQLTLQIGQTKPARGPHKDDLKKIPGIGPAFERVLNKMGIFTFRKIATWDAADMKRIADKLETAPDRIKRDKWIAEAKKEHFRKYGERL
jgi:predicted flap endonuclease-1-like 5' DNA nuclease/chromosome segregation ATPase